jgi:hypothetical protein
MRTFIFAALSAFATASMPSLSSGVDMMACGDDFPAGCTQEGRSDGSLVCAEVSEAIFEEYSYVKSYGQGKTCLCAGVWSYLTQNK